MWGNTLSDGASSLPGALCRFLLNHTLGVIRKEHFLFSIFQAPPDELIKFTRVQRVVCLAAVFVTSLAVVAFLYGQEPINIEDRVATTILAAVFMIPCRVLLPFVFRQANTLPALPRWPHRRMTSAVNTVVTSIRLRRRQRTTSVDTSDSTSTATPSPSAARMFPSRRLGPASSWLPQSSLTLTASALDVTTRRRSAGLTRLQSVEDQDLRVEADHRHPPAPKGPVPSSSSIVDNSPVNDGFATSAPLHGTAPLHRIAYPHTGVSSLPPITTTRQPPPLVVLPMDRVRDEATSAAGFATVKTRSVSV